MSFESEIREARRLQAEGKLRIAAFTAMLAKAGVESYTVNVATLATTYKGRKGETLSESGGSTRVVAGAYNGDLLDAAMQENQRGTIDTAAFHDRLAAAGVASYEARLGDKVIEYQGHGKTCLESTYR